MKKYLLILGGICSFLSVTSCSPEDDIRTPEHVSTVFTEDFHVGADTGSVPAGWRAYAESGTVQWTQGEYSGDRYAEYTAYQSGDAVSIAWLISPAIELGGKSNAKLAFEAAQAYVSTSANSLEVLVSTDYDGDNVLAAHWEPKSFSLPPLDYDTNFQLFTSGVIDLSAYSGKIYIAFRAKGSGTDSSLDGTYEVDNITIF